jgi:hypothetical protein
VKLALFRSKCIAVVFFYRKLIFFYFYKIFKFQKYLILKESDEEFDEEFAQHSEEGMIFVECMYILFTTSVARVFYFFHMHGVLGFVLYPYLCS